MVGSRFRKVHHLPPQLVPREFLQPCGPHQAEAQQILVLFIGFQGTRYPLLYHPHHQNQDGAHIRLNQGLSGGGIEGGTLQFHELWGSRRRFRFHVRLAESITHLCPCKDPVPVIPISPLLIPDPGLLTSRAWVYGAG